MIKKSTSHTLARGTHATGGPRMLRDYVCGMKLTERHLNCAVDYEKKFYYFCSQSCMDRFVEDPKAYITS